MNVKEARQHLAAYNQEHLLQFWDTLTDSEKYVLLHDINDIDFEAVLADFRASMKNAEKQKQLDDQIEPVPESDYCDANKAAPQELTRYEERGLELISESRVAVLVLAGGHGTRLGVPYPKGMYNVGLLSGKSLFQLQAERILRLQELAFQRTGRQGRITLLIMTSESTNEQTLDFFKKYSYFGLDEQNIIVFEQFTLPAFSVDGKIMLADRNRVSLSADGNGGVYRALRDRKVLDELEERGIDYVHAISIDNILVKVGDPHFVGYCAHNDAETGVKVVEKTDPSEAIGVVCLVNEKWKVVEYSEISPATAEQRAEDGSLLFKAGNICNHVFSTAFLRRISSHLIDSLELHIAHKKITTVDSAGKLVKPSATNGIKMEKFIFDVFPFTDKLVVWKVNREEEFSPVKNSNDVGKDCPATARRDLFRLHKSWIENSGGKFKETLDVQCEISPLLSYGGEGIRELTEGKTFESPLLLKAKSE